MINFLKNYLSLNHWVIIGIISGVLFGLLLPEYALQQKVLGNAFVSFLKMLVVPLVLSSVFAAVSGLGSLEQLKNIGLKTVFLYLITTAASVLLAIVMMNIVHIGEVVSAAGLSFDKATHVKEFSAQEMFLSFIPVNIFQALSSGDLMKIIVFAIFLGIASLYLKVEEHKTLLNIASALSNAMLQLAQWIILLTPIGVFSLISYVIADQGLQVVIDLWKYIVLVISVILLHGFLTLPFILWICTKINPYHYLYRIREVPLMAFSTASSAATLPVSMEVAQEKGGVSQQTAAFVLPLGATVSMDGTAAYLTIAVMYIANLSGAMLGFGDQLLLGITVVALSIGVAALPSASLVMMVIILNELGLSVEYLALIVAVDRILDMARTALNVTSDMVVSKAVDCLSQKKK